MNTWLLVFAALLAAAPLVWWLHPACRRARVYMRNVAICGYLPPPPTARAACLARNLAAPILFFQVGRITVIGRENLSINGGSVLTTPNHSHPADNFLMPYVLARPTRYMAAKGWMTACFGLGGLISGPMGCFCVDTNPGMGRPAHDAAVEIMATAQSLNIFPEGGAYPDGVMREAKTGAVRIAKEAAAKIGKPVFIVPTYIRYGKYAGTWIMRLPELLRYLFIFASPWYYRRGVTIVFGAPLSSDDLPEDVHDATALLRERILAQDPAAGSREP